MLREAAVGACPFDKACYSTIADVALLFSSWQRADSTSRTIYCLRQQHRAGSPWCDWIEECSKNERTALIATCFLDQWGVSLDTRYRHSPRYPYFGEPLKSSLLTVSDLQFIIFCHVLGQTKLGIPCIRILTGNP